MWYIMQQIRKPGAQSLLLSLLGGGGATGAGEQQLVARLCAVPGEEEGGGAVLSALLGFPFCLVFGPTLCLRNYFRKQHDC